MSQEFLPHIFESFSRERNTTSGKVLGTGLGMRIVKRLVDLMQGTYPVISLSFADIKATTYESARRAVIRKLVKLYSMFGFIRSSEALNEKDRAYFDSVEENMPDDAAAVAINYMSDYLSRYYNKKVMILLDEYDTPLQEAYIHGYWEKLTAFIRSLFNSTFKTNPYMERGLLTGITRVSKESIFSDLNNLEVVTTTSEKYSSSFGFTEEEVFHALENNGLFAEKENIFTIHGQLPNIWILGNMELTGQTPVEMHWFPI